MGIIHNQQDFEIFDIEDEFEVVIMEIIFIIVEAEMV
jgi:hypothetical protein